MDIIAILNVTYYNTQTVKIITFNTFYFILQKCFDMSNNHVFFNEKGSHISVII